MTGAKATIATRTEELDGMKFKLEAYCNDRHVFITVSAFEASGQGIGLHYADENDSTGAHDLDYRVNVDGTGLSVLGFHFSSEPDNELTTDDSRFQDQSDVATDAKSSRLATAKKAVIEIPLRDGRRPIVDIDPSDSGFQSLIKACSVMSNAQ